MTGTRVPGHGLVAEGAPFDADGRRIGNAIFNQGTYGTGHAKCSCGQMSKVELASAAQRKRWHRDHKNTVLATQATATENSTESSSGSPAKNHPTEKAS